MAEYRIEDLNVWEDFTDAVRDLRVQEQALRASSPGVRIPALLFRGQREASWRLETTMERYGTTSLSLMHYYTSIWAAKSQIEAHTGQRWEIEGTRVSRKDHRL